MFEKLYASPLDVIRICDLLSICFWVRISLPPFFMKNCHKLATRTILINYDTYILSFS